MLGSQGVLEVLCSSEENSFDIVDQDGMRLNTSQGSSLTKDVIFGSFFDIQKIRQACKSHNLEFNHRLVIDFRAISMFVMALDLSINHGFVINRIIYEDRRTVRLVGKVIPHGPQRAGYPVRSSYEVRKKRHKGRGGRDWQQEFMKTGLSKAEVEARSEEAAAICTSLETAVKEARKRLSVLERAKTEARIVHKSNERSRSADQKDSYQALQVARAAFYDERSQVEPKEEALRAAKQRKYFWNKVKKDGTRSGPAARKEEDADNSGNLGTEPR